MALHALT